MLFVFFISVFFYEATAFFIRWIYSTMFTFRISIEGGRNILISISIHFSSFRCVFYTHNNWRRAISHIPLLLVTQTAHLHGVFYGIVGKTFSKFFFAYRFCILFFSFWCNLFAITTLLRITFSLYYSVFFSSFIQFILLNSINISFWFCFVFSKYF